ncbi:helix-turn-helix domain-containing protein [Clostridium sp. Marseille-Q2269]|uniref:helix-turn-helix domain-containing protein n=1 Tax=Clostridium sp. Marseille-Q2269 TaxID=2942205 RepID=UPI0020747761|nr:helix-turn-helix domain-containing protein [Clostridium sp. Marseille-Q2269]
MEDNNSILISPTQGMRVLGVGKNMMYQDLLKRKDFPCMKVGSKYFLNRELLQEWANKNCTKK